ncbi:hypothetical protein ACFVHB_04310 [Kitasatospora sp. NPDC127111]|uniref:hypothetical protein n=1 Tax=Kitasatospora sp. NPDC127111 TaxID=3345363 RepID=UPI00363031F0
MATAALPDRNALLAGRIGQELADLKLMMRALREVSAEAGIGKAAQQRFGMLLADATGQLQGLADDPQHARWADLAAEQDKLTPVKRELLAFVQGLLMQRSVLERDFVEATTRLLDDLTIRSGIKRDVLLSVDVSEFLAPSTSMMRFRFTDTTVWALPSMVHELGHHAANHLLAETKPEYLYSRPVVAHLGTAAVAERDVSDVTEKKARDWLNELFADVYATYALGPAYPLSVIALRAVPDGFDDDLGTHPSWNRRVVTMLGALHEMSERPSSTDQNARFALFADSVVEPLWRSTGAEPLPPDDPAAQQSAEQGRDMVRKLAANTPADLLYPIGADVDRLATGLAEQPAGPPDGTTPAQVVGAAWLWWLNHWNAGRWLTDQVSRSALRLCVMAG